MQVPPMFSAIRVDGKRMYEVARAGKVVKREPRQVHVHEFKVWRDPQRNVSSAQQADKEGQTMRYFIQCSKGTYVRSLIHDLVRVWWLCTKQGAWRFPYAMSHHTVPCALTRCRLEDEEAQWHLHIAWSLHVCSVLSSTVLLPARSSQRLLASSANVIRRGRRWEVKLMS
jgi:hypothetical protein